MSKLRFTIRDLFLWVALAGLFSALLAEVYRSFRKVPYRPHVSSLVVSSDGETAAAIFGNTVRVWRISDGKQVATFKTRGSFVPDLGISGDGTTIAVPNGLPDPKLSGIDLWNVGLPKIVRTLPAPYGCRATISPSGDRVVWQKKGVVELYQPPLGQSPSVRLMSPTGSHLDDLYLHRLTFSPDGELLAVGNVARSTITVFETATCKVQTRLELGDAGLGVMAFSVDGRKLAAYDSGSYCEFEAPVKTGGVWDFSRARRRGASVSFGHRPDLLAYLSDGRTLVAVARQLMFIDTETSQMRRPGIFAFTAAIGHRGNALVTQDDHHHISLRNAADGSLRQVLWADAPISRRGAARGYPMLLFSGVVIWILVFRVRRATRRRCKSLLIQKSV